MLESDSHGIQVPSDVSTLSHMTVMTVIAFAGIVTDEKRCDEIQERREGNKVINDEQILLFFTYYNSTISKTKS